MFKDLGEAAENDATVMFDGEGGEPARWKDGPEGGRGTDTCPCRERDAGHDENADGVVSDKISNASIDEEAVVIDNGGDPSDGGAAAGKSRLGETKRVD